MESEVGSTFHDVKAKLHLIKVKNAPEFFIGKVSNETAVNSATRQALNEAAGCLVISE